MIDPMQPRTLVPGSLDWWLARLGARLDSRRDRMERYEAYYAGTQPLAFVSDTFRAAFGDRFREFSSNFMSLVVDAHRERLQVQGIRIGANREGDEDAWRWWQANRLDAESQIAHTESLVKGLAYVLVWPDPVSGEPEATIESALQVVVETEPGKSWKRRAALKRWLADDGKYRAELYLPDGIYKFKSVQSGADFSVASWSQVAQWIRDDQSPAAGVREDWPVKNPLGIIPIVPIVNRPRLTGQSVNAYGRPVSGAVGPDEGQSEIAMVMSNQDAINKLRADGINASDLAAFRQRWLRNWQVEIDEETGQPVEPFKSAVDRLWILPPPDPEDPGAIANPPEFGEFEQTDTATIVGQIQMEVQHLGAISRTPYHYLLPQAGQPPSGESLKSAETGLVAKVRDSMVHKGESWEEVIRLYYRFRGDARGKDLGAEIIWKDPESRTEAVHTDALVKQQSMGIPVEMLWEGLGYSPRQISRIKDLIAVTVGGALTDPTVPPPDVAPTTDTMMTTVNSALAQGGN
jgi:Phage portal protein, SPP1 Gp6-like